MANIVEIVLRAKNETAKTLAEIRADVEKLKRQFAQLQQGGAGGLDRELRGTATNAKGAAKGVGDVTGEATKLSKTKGTAPLNEGLKQTKGVAPGVGGGLRSVANEAGNLSDKAFNAAKGIRLLVAGFIAFKGIQTAKRVAGVAAEAEVLDTVLGKVAANAGLSSTQIDEMEESVKSLGVTTASARQSLTALIQAGIVGARTTERAAKLADAARNLAVAAGLDTSATLKRLITNIQQGDVVGLRFLGITVDREAAERKLAKSLDITQDALSGTQKTQALYNAVLTQTNKLSGTYEAALSDVDKQLGSLTRKHKTLGEAVGQFLLPAYSALISVYDDFIEELTEVFELTEEGSTASEKFAAIVRTVATAIKEGILFIVEYAEVLGLLAAVFVGGKLLRALVTFGDLVVLQGRRLVSMTGALVTTTVELYAMARAATAASIANGGLLGTLLRATGVLAGYGKALLLARGFGTSLIGVLGRLLGVAGALVGGFQFGVWLRQFKVVQDAARVFVATMAATVKSILAPWDVAVATIGGSLKFIATLLKGGSLEEAKNAFVGQFEGISRDLEFAFAEVRASIDEFGDEAQTAVEKAASKMDGRQIAETISGYSRQILRLQFELDKLRETSDGSEEARIAQERIETQIEELVDVQGQYRKEFAKALNALSGKAKSDLKDFANDQEAPLNEIQAAYEQALKVRDDALEKLFDGKVATSGFGLTKEFLGLKGAIEQLNQPNFEIFKQDFEGATRSVSVNLRTIILGFQQLAESAKSPQELIQAIGLLEGDLTTLSPTLRELKSNLTFKAEEASIKLLDSAIEGFLGRIEELVSTSRLLTEVQNGSTNATAELATVFADFGQRFSGVNQAGLDLSRSLANVTADVEALNEISLDEIKREFDNLSTAYQEDTLFLKEETDRKKALINEQFETEQGRATALKALDAETNRDRLASAKSYFDSLTSLQSQALSKYVEAVNRVKQADQELANLQEQEDDFLRQTRREGLSDFAVYQDRLKELAELTSQARLAALRGEFEEAKRINQRRLQLAKELKGSEGVNENRARRDAVEQFTAAVTDQERVIKSQRQVAKEAADEQLEQYQRLTDRLGELTESIQGIGGERVLTLIAEVEQSSIQAVSAALDKASQDKTAKVIVEVDESSLTQAIQTIKSRVESAKITLNAGLSGSQGFASGGYVSGPGTATSDSIPARLSNGEFVLRADAVRQYGANFLNMLNNLRLPKFAMGGMVSRAMTAVSRPVYRTHFATGGLVRAPATTGGDTPERRDVVDINFNIGGKRVSLMAERQQAREFVDLLNSVEGAR